jgi:hypothetical protein
MWDIERALLAALKAWVIKGTLPPPSVYPTLAAGTLVPANSQAMGFPTVPGMPSPDAIVNPLIVYDFGKSFVANDLGGSIDNEPPTIENVIAARVPRVDADGNEVGGIHTVLQQATLGTYLGWNITASGFFKGQYCSLAGSYIPFEAKRSEREAAHDPRLSVEERYGTHKGYVCAVKRAAANLVRGRLLLQDDADRLVDEATKSEILTAESGVSPGDEAIAARQCSTKQ